MVGGAHGVFGHRVRQHVAMVREPESVPAPTLPPSDGGNDCSGSDTQQGTCSSANCPGETLEDLMLPHFLLLHAKDCT